MSERVLVARLDGAGDVLLTGPAIRAVRAGAGHVTFLCGQHGAEAARLLPGVDAVLVRSAEWIEAEPAAVQRRAVEAFVTELATRHFDRALIFTSYHQSPLPLALLLKMAGVGFVAAISEDYPGSLLDLRHHVREATHEVVRALSLAEAAGYRLSPGDDGRLRVGDVPAPSAALGLPAAGFVVLHPGASVSARAWGEVNMRALRDSLVARGECVVVTGGSAERTLTAAVAGGSCDLGGRSALPVLAGVLAAADVVVTGNTGPAHLAAAVGTPVASLYAPTVPAVKWHPWGVPYRLLGDQGIACAGCRARVCPVPGHPCIGQVPVSAVLDAIDALRAGDAA